MKAEVLSVGTELLMGQIVNTDAAYIARRLTEVGIDTFYQQTVGDNEGRLLQAIALAAGRADVVFLSGGLGPTSDDITKQTLAKYLNLPLVEDAASKAQLENWFASRGSKLTPNNYRQIEFPQGAMILQNEWGTAPGCIVESGGVRYIILPGPPRELEPMMEHRVMPYLRALSGDHIVSKMLKLFGIGESALEYELRDLINGQGRVTIAPYAGFGEVSLRLSVKVGPDEDPEAFFATVEPEIRRRVGKHIYGSGQDSLPGAVAKALLGQQKTLALAESCTGGMIAAELVAIPGISESFVEGCVCYANEAKVRTLGVLESTLASFGAVSEQCAREMCEGMRKRTGADYALSVTGIAGPGGGTKEKPVGLVYIGLAGPKKTQVQRFEFGQDRQRVRRMSMLNALDMLRRELQ